MTKQATQAAAINASIQSHMVLHLYMFVTVDVKVVVAAVYEVDASVKVDAESVKVVAASVKVDAASVKVVVEYVNVSEPTA